MVRIGQQGGSACIYPVGQQTSRAVGAGNGDAAVFERLAHGCERAGAKLGQLVEEEHATVGQGNFAGAGDGADDDEANVLKGKRWPLVQNVV
jgi:hypothetical protein